MTRNRTIVCFFVDRPPGGQFILCAEVIDMLISEAARKSHTTKKAIEYYVEQQLLDLQTQKTGYRQFTEKDIEKLKKISVLRRFGLSVQEIKHILDDPKQETIQRIIEKNKLEQKEKETKNALFEQLAKTQDWESARSQLDILEKRKTIQEKLIDTFPGYYGKYIQLHFGKYLNAPILCEEQQEAFETIIAFLDQAEFKLSDDLRTVLDEMTSQFDEQFVNNTFETMNQIIQDPKQYMKDNKEMIEQYLQIKRSEPFKRSKASQLQQQLMQFNKESGYDTIFIPAMKILSPAYKAYYDQLEKANEIFLKTFQIEK